MGRARDSSAQTTPRTAVAAGAVYSDMLPGGSTIIRIRNPTAILTLHAKNPNGHNTGGREAKVLKNTTVTAGDLVRLGIIAASGNSFCVILVANDSHNRVSGEGWQAVNEAYTQGAAGADCGAEATAINSFKGDA